MLLKSSDFGTGILLVCVGGLFLLLGTGLDRGTAFMMGPGYFPTIVSGLTLLVGAALIVRSLLHAGIETAEMRLYPVIMVCLAMLAFTLLVKPAGLLIAAVVSVAIASKAIAGTSLTKALIAGLCVSVVAGVIFIYLLRLSMTFLPGQF